MDEFNREKFPALNDEECALIKRGRIVTAAIFFQLRHQELGDDGESRSCYSLTESMQIMRHELALNNSSGTLTPDELSTQCANEVSRAVSRITEVYGAHKTAILTQIIQEANYLLDSK